MLLHLHLAMVLAAEGAMDHRSLTCLHLLTFLLHCTEGRPGALATLAATRVAALATCAMQEPRERVICGRHGGAGCRCAAAH